MLWIKRHGSLLLSFQLLSLLLLYPLPVYGRFTINNWIDNFFHPICIWILETFFPNSQSHSGFYSDSPDLIVLSGLILVLTGIIGIIAIPFLKNQQEFIKALIQKSLIYYLSWIFMIYGFAKINGTQFPIVDSWSHAALTEKSSLALKFWHFMGNNPILVSIIALIELLIAFSLLHVKFRSIGIRVYLISIGLIVLINFYFDIDVKMLSLLMLLILAFICFEYREQETLISSNIQTQKAVKLFIVLVMIITSFYGNTII